jgi:hypothetical protein
MHADKRKYSNLYMKSPIHLRIGKTKQFIMLAEDVEKVRNLERPYKREAQKRNGRAILIIILLALAVTVGIISIVAIIEVQVERFSDQLVYDLVVTGLVAILYAAYMISVIVMIKLKIWPLHDVIVSDNNVRQYGYLISYVTLTLSLLIATRWIGFAETNDASNFNDMPGGVIYSWTSLFSWVLCLQTMFVILSSVFTFYRRRQPIYNYVSTRGVFWSANIGDLVDTKYDEATNSTVIVPSEKALQRME